MPNFDPTRARKGGQAIDEAVEARKNRGDGDFKPFLPNFFWKDDKDFKYLLFLTPVEESYMIQLHPYIDLEDGRPHQIMARTDPTIGAKSDSIHDQWGYKPRDTNVAIAVELEPTMEIKGGYEKPTGFEVATRTFDRKILDDDGNPTDEYEEVTAPIIGLVAQSPHNFFNHLRSYDATEGPVHTTALKITRLNGDNVTYSVAGYDTIEVDRANLLDFIENVSYITEPEELLTEIQDMSDEDASLRIGEYLLLKQLNELADEDAYNAILSQITKPARFSDKKKDKKESKDKPARPSQRRSRAKGDDKEEVTKASPVADRIERLKAKSKAAKKAA